LHDDLMRDQSLKRRGVPEDIANAVVFFAGAQSSFVTGQTLLVDGGLFLH
jgi:3-oxoacyl-[acyl-carrier protein] reductase